MGVEKVYKNGDYVITDKNYPNIEYLVKTRKWNKYHKTAYRVINYTMKGDHPSKYYAEETMNLDTKPLSVHFVYKDWVKIVNHPSNTFTVTVKPGESYLNVARY